MKLYIQYLKINIVLLIFAYLSNFSPLFAQLKDSLRFDKETVSKQLRNYQLPVTSKKKQSTSNKEQETTNKKQETCVILFLDTECPICQKYTLKIKEIDSVCRANQIPLIGVFTDRKVKKQAIEHFKNKYGLKINTLIDRKLALAKALKASTTPEVFFLDRVGERIVYRGLIDNWFYRLGKSRAVPTEHYLLDVVDSYLKKQEMSVKKTTPIGCLIQY
jgi:thioredoxin-related protein